MTETGLIPLADGGHAVVDAADVDFLSLLSWYRKRSGRNRREYAASNLPGGGKISMHRLLMLAGAGERVDHRDGDGLNNRRSNLRLASSADNARNQRRRRGRVLYKGVTFRRNSPGRPWVANLGGHRTGAYLGSYRTAEEAALAYDIAALERWGEFAHTNLLKP
jgi:hypothetical protein